MSILVMGIMLTVVEATYEGIMAIIHIIGEIVGRMMHKRKLRNRRGGRYIERNYGYKNPYSIL